MLIAASAFILGILSAFYWPLPALLLCIVFFVLSIAYLIRSARKRCLAVLCLLFGFFWANLYLQSYQSSLVPMALEGKDIVLLAEISEIPVKQYAGWRFVVKVKQSWPHTQMRSLRLNWYQDKIIPKLGDTGYFTVRLKRPHGYANPGGFDVEKWMFSRGLHGRGYVRYADMHPVKAVASAVPLQRQHTPEKAAYASSCGIPCKATPWKVAACRGTRTG